MACYEQAERASNGYRAWIRTMNNASKGRYGKVVNRSFPVVGSSIPALLHFCCCIFLIPPASARNHYPLPKTEFRLKGGKRHPGNVALNRDRRKAPPRLFLASPIQPRTSTKCILYGNDRFSRRIRSKICRLNIHEIMDRQFSSEIVLASTCHIRTSADRNCLSWAGSNRIDSR